MKLSIQKESSNNNLLLWVILAASFFRLHGLIAFSLTNDELSALARLQFSSLAEVITKGVYPDFHPAGVEVFLYYWTWLTGFNEWMIRLPFALMGIGSVYFLYRVGSDWFGKATGLISAAALASLQYPVLYSQIARPYSPGLFFSILAVFFWTKVLFTPKDILQQKQSVFAWFAGFVLSVSACMYIHYFSFIFAGIICFTGLFFLRRDLILPYLLSGLTIVLLYVPHLGIFLHQVAKGGVGGPEGWLGPPGKDTFGKYLDYCFNDSTQLKLLYFIVTSGTILVYRKYIRLHRFHLLSLAWFAVPFLIAYYYSIHKNPVFQYSVLLFSFPFLLLLFFSFIPRNTNGITFRILFFILFAGTAYSTVYEKKYYHTAHFSEFRKLAERIIQIDSKYGETNVTKVTSVFDPYYIQYYLKKENHNTQLAISSIMSDGERARFNRIVEQSTTPYFLIAWSNVFDDPEFDMVIRSKFPWLIERDSMLQSGIRVYSRISNIKALNPVNEKIYSYGFEENAWDRENDFRDTAVFYEGKASIHIEPFAEFGPGHEWVFPDSLIAPGSVIEVNAAFRTSNDSTGASLVISLDSGGKNLVYEGALLKHFIDQPLKWSRVFLKAKIPAALPAGASLKIYCWNRDKSELWMDDFRMAVYSGR